MAACHVLIVENDELNRLLMGDILSLNGHTFKTAENGLEAIDLFQNEFFDIVFLDLQMPLLDGFETLKLIRFWDEKRGVRTPVALLSGSQSVEGFDYHLRKPFSPSDVLAILTTLSSGSTQKTPSNTPSTFFHEERPQLPHHPYCEADIIAAFEKTDDHLDFFEMLLLKSVETSATLLAHLTDALNSGDYALALKSAHALKGPLSIFNIYDAMYTIEQLEKVLQSDKPPAANSSFVLHFVTTLHQEIDNSTSCLTSFIQHKKTTPESLRGGSS